MEQFEFKRKHRLRFRGLPAEMTQKPDHQIINRGQGRLGFRRLFDKRRGISRLAQTREILAQDGV